MAQDISKRTRLQTKAALDRWATWITVVAAVCQLAAVLAFDRLVDRIVSSGLDSGAIITAVVVGLALPAIFLVMAKRMPDQENALVSYSAGDLPTAEAVADTMKRLGFRVSLEPQRASGDVPHLREARCRKAPIFVPIVSDAWLESDTSKIDLQAAESGGATVIPVGSGNTKLPPELRGKPAIPADRAGETLAKALEKS